MERSGRYASPPRSGCSGRPALDHSQKLQRLRGVDVEERSTARSAAAACGMAPTTLFEQLRQGKLRKFTSVVKPVLTEANKHQRLKISLTHIDPDTMMFDTMMDTVHVDEKLFYITQPSRHFLLLPDEAEPIRRLRSKRYITKVMFLSAEGRPRYDSDTKQVCLGKLGIWSFVEWAPAQRPSARHLAGTIVTKETSVIKSSYRTMLISNQYVLVGLEQRMTPPFSFKR
ncbi:unnamed protein product [Phytophthora fragariaefolia]|uniref:Unnamed protein product n=1 Tax=Phytophthora fragariaefolia TaxID=1490495 RepID=A0A9W6XQL4_9STRA|nr:unnamed protein product [Phytophthora fragariaefolia]